MTAFPIDDDSACGECSPPSKPAERRRVRIGGENVIRLIGGLLFDLEDGHVARIIDPPLELKGVGVTEGDQVCGFDGEAGFLVVDELLRGERVLPLGVPVMLKFASKTEAKTISIRVLFSGQSSQPVVAEQQPSPEGIDVSAEEVDLDRERAVEETLLAEFRKFAADSEPARALSEDQKPAPVEPLLQLPRREIGDEGNSPFGFRRWPATMPISDQNFYESHGRGVSYCAQDESYNVFPWPNRGSDGTPIW
jgi:hypothetical protein